MIQSDSPEAAMLVWLVDHGPMRSAAIAEACGIDVSSVRGRLSALVGRGLVVRKSTGEKSSARVYTINDGGRREATRCARRDPGAA